MTPGRRSSSRDRGLGRGLGRANLARERGWGGTRGCERLGAAASHRTRRQLLTVTDAPRLVDHGAALTLRDGPGERQGFTIWRAKTVKFWLTGSKSLDEIDTLCLVAIDQIQSSKLKIEDFARRRR